MDSTHHCSITLFLCVKLNSLFFDNYLVVCISLCCYIRTALIVSHEMFVSVSFCPRFEVIVRCLQVLKFLLMLNDLLPRNISFVNRIFKVVAHGESKFYRSLS